MTIGVSFFHQRIDNWCVLVNWLFLTFKRLFKPKSSLKEHKGGILLIFFQLLYFLLKYGQNLHEVEGLENWYGCYKIPSGTVSRLVNFFGLVLFFRESERVQFV